MGNGKIRHSADAKPLNRPSPNLKLVIRSGTYTTKNYGSIRSGDFAPIYPKYTSKTFECLLYFFQFFRAPTDEPVGPIFAFSTSYNYYNYNYNYKVSLFSKLFSEESCSVVGLSEQMSFQLGSELLATDVR